MDSATLPQWVGLKYTTRSGRHAGFCGYDSEGRDTAEIVDEVREMMARNKLPGTWMIPGVQVSVEIIQVGAKAITPSVEVRPPSWGCD